MKVIDWVNLQKITICRSKNLKEVWSTMVTTFHWIYRKLVAEKSTVLKLTSQKSITEKNKN